MTLRPELMSAILSMDAYNRGYEASIELSTISGFSKLGEATIVTTSSSLLICGYKNLKLA